MSCVLVHISNFWGWQGWRTLHVLPSLPSPLIFKPKFKMIVTLPSQKSDFKISVTLALLEKGQSQYYGASRNSNGLLTLSGLLSLKFLLHMTTSFTQEEPF